MSQVSNMDEWVREANEANDRLAREVDELKIQLAFATEVIEAARGHQHSWGGGQLETAIEKYDHWITYGEHRDPRD